MSGSRASQSFAIVARVVSDAARGLGLTVPAFRAPPRIVGTDRTIRRRGDHVTVAVRVQGRPWGAIIADLVEGVIIANDLDAVDAGKPEVQDDDVGFDFSGEIDRVEPVGGDLDPVGTVTRQ